MINIKFKPVFVVLTVKDDALYGIVEHSFTMGLAEGRANLFFSGGYWGLVGKEDADHHAEQYAKQYPKLKFKVWSIDDPDLPIEIDWDRWKEAGSPAKTLSGVKNKYHARNVSFREKEKDV